MTHFRNSPRFYRGQHSDQVSRVSDQKWGLYSIHKIFSKIWTSDLVSGPIWPHFKTPLSFHQGKKVWPRFMSIGLKMWLLKHTQCFSKNWPSDLVFNPNDPFSHSSKISSRPTFWPSFMNIWPKMWPQELTQGFSKIWPSDQISTQRDPFSPPRFHKSKYSDQVSYTSDWKCGLWSKPKVLLRFDLVT